MANKISLIGQIAEVDRELAMRAQVYQRNVQAGKMRQAEADLLIERMHAVRATLAFCREHEADIREYIAKKKAGAA